MLLSLGYIGIPFWFAANFTLVRRLQRRPEEERQRLLSAPIVLVPDPWHSEDWVQTLEAQRGIAPDIFVFDPRNDAQPLHAFCAGRKRAMAKLLLLSFRDQHPARGKVGLEAIRRAYHSTAYTSFREETEILVSQAIRNCPDTKRKDLWCPLPLPENAAAAFLRAGTAARDAQVAQAELRAALTQDERQAIEHLERSRKRKPKAGDVVPLRKKTDVSGEDLKRNANWFRDQL